MKIREKLSSLIKYSPVVCFLTYEVFALIAFSLSNSVILFGSLSLVLALILAIFSFSEIKKDGFLRSLVFIIPLVVYLLFTLVGPYTRAHVNTGDFPVADVVFVGIGLTSVAFIGYFLTLHKAFKISTLLTVIFSALTILVFINLIINMINFGPFYTIKYKEYYMYYAGSRSTVTVDNIAYTLEGFKFIETKISHYTIYPLILLSSSLILIDLKWKENKAKFLAYCLFSFMAILALVLVPSLIGLIFAIVIALIIGFVYLFRFKQSLKKPFSIVLYVVLGLAGVVLLVMIFNKQDFAGGFAQIIKNNYVLDKLFNSNSYARLYNPNITNILCSERFFGYYAHQVAYFYEDLAHLTDSILFDNFMTSGVLGVALLCFIIVLGYKGMNKCSSKVNNLKQFVPVIVAIVTVYLLFSFMNADGEYAIFHNVIRPTYTSSLFMIVVFLLSYMFCSAPYEPKQRKEEFVNEI